MRRDPESDSQEAGLAARRALRDRDGRGRLSEQVPASPRQQPPGLGQPHVSVAPHEQRPADSLLEPLDTLAQRRLRHEQPLGRPAEMQRLPEHDDRLEIVQPYIHNHRLSDEAAMFHWTAWGTERQDGFMRCKLQGVQGSRSVQRRFIGSTRFRG